jgi:hemoglobin
MSEAPATAASLYEAVGGAERLRAIVHRFVSELDTLPSAGPLRRLFAADLRVHEQRLFEFLSGWLGGPALYTQRHGLPNLRARHRHLPIGNAERDQWLLCMRRALATEVPAVEVRARLDAAFWTMACSLRNCDEADAAGSA